VRPVQAAADALPRARTREDPKLERRQERLAGPWAGFALGCRCDRDTVALVKRRFDIEDMGTACWRGMPSVVHPLIIGTATLIR
jgi:hypothetical protein